MECSYSSITEYLSQEGHVMYLWNPEDRLDVSGRCSYSDHMSFFVVLTGRIEMLADGKRWVAVPGDVLIFAYDREFSFLYMSEDYTSMGIIFSNTYWNETLMNVNPSIYAAKLYPVVPVDHVERRLIIDFMEEVHNLKDRGKADCHPVVINCLRGLIAEIGRVYDRLIDGNPVGSHVRLLADFASLLKENYKVRRDVPFYADGMNLSRSHFSALILQITGLTVGTCIRKYVAYKICRDLKEGDKSIKEISIEYGFRSASNFCKFFRDHVGMTPQEYRRRNRCRY